MLGHLKAQSDNVSDKMEVRGLESRQTHREPSFFQKGSVLRRQGVYFGVGFRHLSFTLGNKQTIDSNEATRNGVGFNLGLYDEAQIYEYERQVSIVDGEKTLVFENQSGRRLEVIQETLAYSWFPRILKDLHTQIGGGLQGIRTRFAATGSSSSYHAETALSLILGMGYFSTPNLMLLFRYSNNWHLDVEQSGAEPFLKASKIRTLFLNYYYPM